MIEFKHGFSTMRVWLDEIPDCYYPVATVSEHITQAESHADGSIQSAAVELRLARGPHNPYGLLGATFRPDQAGRLLLQVVSSDDEMAEDCQ